jgi:hypothetical protein
LPSDPLSNALLDLDAASARALIAELVALLAERLNSHNENPASSQSGVATASAFRFEGRPEERLARRMRAPLPDPRLVRRIIRHRRLRARYFDGDLFADPAWDMLLDLTAARVEHTRVSVTSLCLASGVPPTTALRWVSQMMTAGLLERMDDETDRRRAFITLSEKAVSAMARYFGELGRELVLTL